MLVVYLVFFTNYNIEFIRKMFFFTMGIYVTHVAEDIDVFAFDKTQSHLQNYIKHIVNIGPFPLEFKLSDYYLR